VRAALLQPARERVADHPGLAYDVWAPAEAGTGKVPDGQRPDWLGRLIRSAGHLGTEESGYPAFFRRWRQSFGEADVVIEIKARSRLLLGHGNPAATEVGLTLHHTWGVPIIPGSAIKGLLNHYVDASYGPSHPGAEPDRQPFGGVVWDEQSRRIVAGPGEQHRALFGGPAWDKDPFGAAGGIVFHDALWVPAPGGFLAPDVITVHQKAYYDKMGAAWPNDYTSPVPIGFLTVKPGQRFLLAISSREGGANLLEFAKTELLCALDEWGIGAKTSSGYGRLGRADAPAGGDGGARAIQVQLDPGRELLIAVNSLNPSNAASEVPKILDRAGAAKREWAEKIVAKLGRKWVAERRERFAWAGELMALLQAGERQ